MQKFSIWGLEGVFRSGACLLGLTGAVGVMGLANTRFWSPPKIVGGWGLDGRVASVKGTCGAGGRVTLFVVQYQR
ncbi:hypothetical protein M434DRAFT_394345 [Hypoxylon sp. CO27-5]|nr:hypothetical protein M434DRAFT_394345 [Hypoxylon sp. CO27-5]